MSNQLGIFPFGSVFAKGFGDLIDEIANNSAAGNIACYKVENEAGIKFMFDVPGVQKDALDLGFENDGRVLSLTAVRKFDEENKVSMNARVAVPGKYDTCGEVKCALEDGVLSVTVPVKKEAQPRKLTIA